MNDVTKGIGSVIAIIATALTIISGIITIYVFFSGNSFFIFTQTASPSTSQPTSVKVGNLLPYGWGIWIIWIIFGFLCAWWLISWVTEHYDADGCFSGCWVWLGLWAATVLVELGARLIVGLFVPNPIVSVILSLVILGIVTLFYTAWLVDNS